MDSNYYLNMKEIQYRNNLCILKIEYLLDKKSLWFKRRKNETYKKKLDNLYKMLDGLYRENATESIVFKR